MKVSQLNVCFFMTFFAALFGTALTMHGATFYWDENGTTAGYGTASTTNPWQTGTVSRWSTSSNGTGTPGASVTTTTSDTLNFGNGTTGLGAGTITVSGAVDSGNMTFASGSGAIVLSGSGTDTITFNATPTITVNNASDTIGAIVAGAATSLTKAGMGTLVLTDANTYTGATIISAGTIDLGGGGTTGSLSSTVLTLNGGSFNYTRTDSATQGFTTTNINSSVSSISVDAGNTLNLGTVVRGAGVVFDFSTTGAGTVAADASNNVNGIMAGFDFGGTSWAVANGSGSAITGLASFTTTTSAGDTASNYTNANIDVDSSQTPDAAITANSLRFNDSSAARTLNLQGANVLTSGGILVTSTVGANTSTITGGTLAGSASGDLAVIQKNTSGGLTIASAITDNSGATALTKSGDGLLTLSGTNTFTGGLFLNAGEVRLNNAGALNSTSGSENAVTSGAGSTGTLALNGNNVVVRSLNSNATTVGTPVVENGNASTSAVLTIGNSGNQNSTFAGVIQDGTGSAALGIKKVGTGTLIMSGVNTFTGGVEISDGTIQVYNNANEQSFLGASTNTLTFTGDAQLHNANGEVTLPQGITINNGVTAEMRGAFGERTLLNGVLAGSGTMVVQGGSAGWDFRALNTANTFSGAIKVDGTSGNALLQMSSLNDAGASSGTKISLASNSNDGGQFVYLGASAPLVLNNYQFELINDGNSGTNYGRQAEISNSSATANTLTINNNLVVTGTGTKNLVLGGGNTGDNTFAGDIPDGSDALSIYKTDGGKWILSGSNTYTGNTTVNNGTLEIGGSGVLGGGSYGGNITVNASDTMTFNSSADQTLSGTITSADASATLNFTGTGKVTVTGDVSGFSGNINATGPVDISGSVGAADVTIADTFDIGTGVVATFTQASGSNLSLSAGTVWNIDVQDDGTYDKIVSVGGSTLELPDGTVTINVNVIDSVGYGVDFTIFDGTLTGEAFNAANFIVSGGWTIDGGSLILTSFIPEPSTIILAGLGLMGITFRRRRRN